MMKSITHLHAASKTTISKLIASETAVKDRLKIDELLKIGAVYIRDSPDTPVYRVFNDMEVNTGDYVRVYLYPKRYPVEKYDWRKLITFSNENCIIVNKPNGIPSHTTVDNQHENMLSCVKLTVGEKERDSLVLAHRLDQDTAGLILINRNEKFNKYFISLMNKHLVVKKYKALVAYNIETSHGFSNQNGDKDTILGGKNNYDSLFPNFSNYLLNNHLNTRLTHFQPESDYSPKLFNLVRESPTDLICNLKIKKISKPVIKNKQQWLEWIHNTANRTTATATTAVNKLNTTDNDLTMLQSAMQDWMSGSNPSESETSVTKDGTKNDWVAFQEVEVQLITGRTHQIRGQVQALSNQQSDTTNSISYSGSIGDMNNSNTPHNSLSNSNNNSAGNINSNINSNSNNNNNSNNISNESTSHTDAAVDSYTAKLNAKKALYNKLHNISTTTEDNNTITSTATSVTTTLTNTTANSTNTTTDSNKVYKIFDLNNFDDRNSVDGDDSFIAKLNRKNSISSTNSSNSNNSNSITTNNTTCSANNSNITDSSGDNTSSNSKPFYRITNMHIAGDNIYNGSTTVKDTNFNYQISPYLALQSYSLSFEAYDDQISVENRNHSKNRSDNKRENGGGIAAGGNVAGGGRKERVLSEYKVGKPWWSAIFGNSKY